MQRKNYLSTYQLLTILLFCILTLGIVSGTYIHKVEQLLQEQVELMLQEVTLQGVNRIEERLKEELILLESLSNGLLKNEELSNREKLEGLKIVKKVRNLRNIGVALPNGHLALAEGSNYNIKGLEYFENALLGQRSISDLTSSQIDGEKIIAYGLPIYDGKEVAAVLVATYDTEYLIGKVMVDFFQGEGTLYVLEEGGQIQYSTKPLEQDFIDRHQKWHQSNDQQKLVKEYGNNICEGYLASLNTIYYTIEHIRNKEGWHLLYTVSEDIIARNVKMTLHTMVQIAMWMSLLFTLVMAYTLITGEKNKRKIYKLAYISEQTGLYNRNRFIEEAQYRMSKYKKEYTLVTFSVDNFKVYNEMFGERFGERLIKRIAAKLNKRLKAKDVLYGHLEQDQFAILMGESQDEKIMQLVHYLEKRFEKIRVEEYPYVHIILSIGIYMIPKGGADIIGALNKASLARQSAEGHHDKRHRFFDEKEGKLIREDKQIEAGILNAIEEQQFSVYYQPKFMVSTGKMAGAEALIRWKHPTDGFISPGKFIPLAESNGSIVEITKFVIEQVCKDVKGWQEQGLTPVPIAVNFSQVEMYNLHILEYIKNCLFKYDIDARYLEIEITERVAIEDLGQAKKMIHAFRNLGIKVAMDDFGTGYSGAGYMKHLPFDIIKIDKVLIDDIDTDDKSRQLLMGLVHVIKSLGLSIVAEGVENTKQLQHVTNMGVDYIQGYVFAKPLPKQGFEDVLKTSIISKKSTN